MTTNPHPLCDMERDCAEQVTHIGEKGFVYCAKHVGDRRGWERCRAMRPWERRLVASGKPLRSYERMTLRSYLAEQAKKKEAPSC
jgi:hypothetical protein